MSSVHGPAKMHPAYTQQTYGQYPPTPSQNSGSGSSSRPRVPDSEYMASGFAQSVAPAYNAQSYTAVTQDVYRDQLAVPTGPGNRNDAYVGGSISGNLGQGETNYAGHYFGTNQVPGPTMNTPLAGANTNQGASPVWRLHNCWVSRAEQDEIHLTIALKKT